MMRRYAQVRLDNLEILIEEAGSAVRLARLANTSASYLSQVRHQLTTRDGTPRGVGDALAGKLEQAMGKAHGWMDEPQEYVRAPANRAMRSAAKTDPELRALHPLISWDQARDWGALPAELPLPVAEALLPCPIHCSSGVFVLRVSGQSMEPEFRDGDLIFVDPKVAADNGRYVVVRLDEPPDATLKQLIVEGNRRFLKALNPDWPNRIVEVDKTLSICGVVVCSARAV